MKNRRANNKSKVSRDSESRLLPSTPLPSPPIPSTPSLPDTGENRGTCHQVAWSRTPGQDTWAGDLGRASWADEPAIIWPFKGQLGE